MICLALRTDVSCRPEATPTEFTNTPRSPSPLNSAWTPSPLPTWLHPKTLRGPPSPYLPHPPSLGPPSWCDSLSWIPKRWSATWTSSSTAPRSRRTRILRAFGCSNCRRVGRRQLPLHSLSSPLPRHRMRIWHLSRITCCGLSTRIFHPARRCGFNWLEIYTGALKASVSAHQFFSGRSQSSHGHDNCLLMGFELLWWLLRYLVSFHDCELV